MRSDAQQQRKATVPIRTILGMYLRSSKRYLPSMVATFVLYGLGHALGDVLVPVFYRDIFDILASGEPGTTAWELIRPIFLLIVLSLIAHNVIYRFADYLVVHSQTNMMREVTNTTFAELQRHSYSFFTGSFAGSLVAKVRRFTRSLETIYDKVLFEFWFVTIQLVGIFIVLVWTMPPVAAVFGVWCVLYILMSYAFARFRFRFDLRAAAADSAVTGELSDAITNILNLKMFATGKRENARFAGATHKEYKARKAAWHMGNVFHAVQGASMAALEIGGMYMALQMWLRGEISAGTVILVQAYFAQVMTKIWGIGRAISDTYKAISDAEEMASILLLPIEVEDPGSPEPQRFREGAIRMQNVMFRYRDGKTVFSDFSITVPAGQRVGVVGHSGAGKSTLFKLLLRFADVTQGSIAIDGQDIRSVTQDDLRGCISYVPQEPILFHRSLYENIAYAKPDATREEVEDAARRAHAHDFIEKMPKGYDTLVGERGVKLSGGERQRVALARVILKNAPILLLDEATSSLDSISEKFIQEQIAVLMRGKTTLAIAHRISTITQMDRIIVMDEGRIVEDGTHDELLAKKGTYAELWSHQSNGFLLGDEDDEMAEDMEVAQDES